MVEPHTHKPEDIIKDGKTSSKVEEDDPIEQINVLVEKSVQAICGKNYLLSILLGVVIIGMIVIFFMSYQYFQKIPENNKYKSDILYNQANKKEDTTLQVTIRPSNDITTFNKKEGFTSSIINYFGGNNKKEGLENKNFKEENRTLKDYWIFSSYNSCLGGSDSNDFVDLHILENLLRLGVRAFDFEIFSVDGKTVVAVGNPSEQTEFLTKNSVNHIPIKDVMNSLYVYGFQNPNTPNNIDPLFVNLRIKSNNPRVYSDITNSVWEIFEESDHLLPQGFSVYNNLYKKMKDKKYFAANIIDYHLGNFKNKIIFMCDDLNTNSPWAKWKKEDGKSDSPISQNQEGFLKIINISNIIGNSIAYPARKLTTDVMNPKETKKDLKLIMGKVYPDITSTENNPNWKIPMATYGAQFVFMKFNYEDNNLTSYLSEFHKEKTAFIKKPPAMIFERIKLKAPVKQNPNLNYAKKPIKSENAILSPI